MLSKLFLKLEERFNSYLLKEKAVVPARWRKFLAWYYPDARVRKKYLSYLGVHMGKGTYSNVGLVPVTGRSAAAYIGNNVSIGPNLILILDSSPNNGNRIAQYNSISDRLSSSGNIVIGDEAWIGANVTILPNITVGECAVLGAGCVLTKDADPFGIYAGVPARKIGDIRDERTDK